VTFGREDVSSHAAVVPKDQVLKMMKSLEQ